MKNGLNKVMLIGNVGRDPEKKELPSGSTLLNFSVATNESFKNKEGEWQDRTEWHNIVVWGKRAEGLSKILSKGMPLYIEGKLQTRSWEDRDGNKRYMTEVVAWDIKLLGSKGGSKGSSTNRGNEEYGGDPGFSEDDIPF